MVASGQPKIMPITTKSPQARIDFEAGRNAAFHYNFHEAWKYLDAAIEQDSTFVLAYLHRGGMSDYDMKVRAGFFDHAKKHQSEATKAEQTLIRAFEAFLNPEEEKRDFNLAIKILKQLHEEFPDDRYLPTYIGLRYLWNLNEPLYAEQYFKKAIKIDPYFAQAHHWLGIAQQHQKNYEKAEEAFIKSAMLAPKEPRPLYALGMLYLEKGEKDTALAYFRQVLERDPNFSETLNVLFENFQIMEKR